MESKSDKSVSLFGPDFLLELIDLLPAHIFWKNIEGVYLGCNAVFSKGLGFRCSDEVVGKTDYDFPVLENFCERYRRDDKEVILSKRPKLNIEESQVLATGETAYLLTSKVPLFDDKKNVIGVLGIYSDITEEKRADWLAAQNDMQEKQIEGMSLLANAIAHELRTPLSGIGMGMSSLHQAIDVLKPAYDFALENGYEGKVLSSRIDRNLHRVIAANKNQVRAGLTYIDMMLANARSGMITDENFCKLSVKDTLISVLDEYPFQDDQEKKLVNVDIKADFFYQGDSHYIKLVFFNLIKNSLYFIKAANKGKIIIRIEAGDDKNTIIFEDTAQGVKDDVLQNMFDRFYSRRNGGSGIGLSFCREVIKAHKGNINCESTFGEYTRFIMSFPSKITTPNCVLN